ncbi:MAG: 30S ribosomal protein S20 [Omnitrophica WOR_2 bacterium RIFCSPLOWO2_01_FULL_41_12]|nr:MAG: 30S ribosomal protein S20 [Omnitrophica WOR_2 bacterium RIFCSPLOWO2_01_FULL_41_12]
MPRRRTSLKRKRADKKRHLHNVKIKNELKKTLKKFKLLLSTKNINEAKDLLKRAFSQLDKAAKKRIIHPRTANRKKSRLAKRLFKTT